MLKHIVQTQDFDQEFISVIFNLAKKCKRIFNNSVNHLSLGDVNKRDKMSRCLHNKVISVIFFEPSTRTRLSFESAIVRLGAYKLSTENASQFSSAAKGEALRDTIRIMSGYSDCIVLRHKDKGSAQEAVKYSKVPIINAGDGDGQHPTQSLLDLFTIQDHFGDMAGRTVLLSGDLMYSRTIHSLVYLLAKCGVRVFLASPPGLELPPDLLDYLSRKNVEYFQFDSMVTAVKTGEVDVLYHTRPQKERYLNRNNLINYDECKDSFTITRELANKMKKDAIILHPLPRTDEIRFGVDENYRAKYFEQAENGLYVRMALLIYLLGDVQMVSDCD